MIATLRPLFEKEGITLYRALPFTACQVKKPHLLTQLSFIPKSVCMLAIPYRTGKECARLSKYAISRDYHLYFKEFFAVCQTYLETHASEAHFAFFYDHSPIDEIEAAVACGLGVRGDNHLLITEEYGSYIFLGEILSDLPYTESFVPQSGTCLHCGLCQKACPSPSHCLSAITQKKQALEAWEIQLMKQHQTAWGCDICQDVCPMNRAISPSPIAFFHKDTMEEFTSTAIESMDEETFAARAFSWRGRACVLRNLKLLEEDDQI